MGAQDRVTRAKCEWLGDEYCVLTIKHLTYRSLRFRRYNDHGSTCLAQPFPNATQDMKNCWRLIDKSNGLRDVDPGPGRACSFSGRDDHRPNFARIKTQRRRVN